jgi:hypothetical protein
MDQLTSADFAVPEAGRITLRQPFDQLARTITQRAYGRRVYFMRGDGNYGDGLIRHAAELFLADVGITPALLDMSRRTDKLAAIARALADPYGRRALFVFNGGGGWAEHCSTALRDVARQLRVTADVVVLPSTIEVMPLDRLPTIFRRDQAESRLTMPASPFCHDMAFYLALLPMHRWYGGDLAIDRRTGVFFRQDNESRVEGGADLPQNLDLSRQGNHLSDIGWFLREIARCEHVITDRLHVAVAGALLGRRVSLAHSSTFKIRAVYEASIAPFFPRCELVSDAEALRRAAA